MIPRSADPRRTSGVTAAPVSVTPEVVPSTTVAPSLGGAQPWAGWPTDWGSPGWSGKNWWDRVERLTDTAWMCIDRNASVIATMPPYLVGAAKGLSADWMNNPDPAVYGSWFQFAHQLIWDLELGDAFVMPTDWYASGWPSRFHVVPPYLVTSDLDRAGMPRHKIGGRNVTDDILHIWYQKRTDEARGHGPLEAGRARVIAANALMRYGTNLAASGGLPYALLIHPGRLTADQATLLRGQWVGERVASMGLPGVLSGGVDLKTLSFDPEKMALLDLSRFNEARICYLLGVPAPLVGLPSGQDSMHYDNQLMARNDHWQSGLKPLVERVMQALSGWALPRGTTIEVNRDEYLREGLLERSQAWAILFQNGVITTDEWREAERFSASAPTESLSAGVLQ